MPLYESLFLSPRIQVPLLVDMRNISMNLMAQFYYSIKTSIKLQHRHFWILCLIESLILMPSSPELNIQGVQILGNI